MVIPGIEIQLGGSETGGTGNEENGGTGQAPNNPDENGAPDNSGSNENEDSDENSGTGENDGKEEHICNFELIEAIEKSCTENGVQIYACFSSQRVQYARES